MENFYLNKNGDSVFTSEFLKNKGTCCKSGCLHCPYGHTLNKFGIEIRDLSFENESHYLE